MKTKETIFPEFAGTLCARDGFKTGPGCPNGQDAYDNKLVVMTNNLHKHVLWLNFQGSKGNNVVCEDVCPSLLRMHGHDVHVLCYGIDQQGGKGNASYTEGVAPTLLSNSHGTPNAVAVLNGKK